MTKRFWSGLALLLVVPGFLLAASCAKKAIKSEPGAGLEQAGERGAGERGMSLEEQRLKEERLREEARARAESTEREAFENERIYFEFDKSTLLPESITVLKKKAKWLSANSQVSITIEGHCDERGTNEYNIALGDRRAQAAKGYLIDLGIDARRMTTISFGEERPADPGHNEAAWAKNRRDEFIIE
jgi:peptidoglycan-associated lipoprotein